jgi:glucokinase
MILAGDVGGTKVHLALYNFVGGRLGLVRENKFPSGEHASLDEIVKLFLCQAEGAKEEIIAACFGCPGPVKDGRLKLTNLPWTLDERDLETSVGIEHIFLINDLEANGYGIPELAPDKVFTLLRGDPSAVGHRGLVSAGTGLGEALLIWDAKTQKHRPLPSEGGHCDFAARNDREIALLEYLRRVLKGRVSFERVVSGLGHGERGSERRDR